MCYARKKCTGGTPMNKQDVIEFFDRLAPGWDADMIKSDVMI